MENEKKTVEKMEQEDGYVLLWKLRVDWPRGEGHPYHTFNRAMASITNKSWIMLSPAHISVDGLSFIIDREPLLPVEREHFHDSTVEEAILAVNLQFPMKEIFVVGPEMNPFDMMKDCLVPINICLNASEISEYNDSWEETKKRLLGNRS